MIICVSNKAMTAKDPPLALPTTLPLRNANHWTTSVQQIHGSMHVYKIISFFFSVPFGTQSPRLRNVCLASVRSFPGEWRCVKPLSWHMNWRAFTGKQSRTILKPWLLLVQCSSCHFLISECAGSDASGILHANVPKISFARWSGQGNFSTRRPYFREHDSYSLPLRKWRLRRQGLLQEINKTLLE